MAGECAWLCLVVFFISGLWTCLWLFVLRLLGCPLYRRIYTGWGALGLLASFLWWLGVLVSCCLALLLLDFFTN